MATREVASYTPTYPADGEIFELTLDGDLPENQPLEMVWRIGYDKTEEWRFNGARVTGIQTRRFKLVSIGYCASFEEVKRKLKPHGKIPEGQWREPFRARYKGYIGIADASWASPSGSAVFPSVNTRGYSNFHYADGEFSDSWRWLVEVE